MTFTLESQGQADHGFLRQTDRQTLLRNKQISDFLSLRDLFLLYNFFCRCYFISKPDKLKKT